MNDQYPLALSIGTVLAGQYVIERVLGQGGFGITYCARDHKTGNYVAIKEYFPDTMATRSQTVVVPYTGERGDNYAYGKECFLQEAETLAQFIGNNGIVRIYSYFEENGTAYFVMDYVEGTSFDEYIKERGGTISYEETVKLLSPVMDALAIVHGRGIIHRDVTPDNIFMTKDGTVKLLDFGAARYSLGDRSQSLDVVLKHGFAPKEQYVRRGRQGPYTDVYALGATFYFALTGKRPPDSIERMDKDELVPPSTLGAKLPKEAEQAILKALNVQPADRFQNMQAFKSALGQTVDNGVQPTVQRFFTAPQPSAPQNIGATVPAQSYTGYSTNMTGNASGDLNRYIAKGLAYIDEHMQQFKFITAGLFGLLALFHLFMATRFAINNWFIHNNIDYKYTQLLMTLPATLICGVHAYCVLTKKWKYLKKTYLIGIAGFTIYILYSFLIHDFTSYAITNSYYGTIYIISGFVLLCLAYAREIKKNIPTKLLYILCVVQSFGLLWHLTKDYMEIFDENAYDYINYSFDTTSHAIIFALTNLLAFILFFIIYEKQKNEAIE